jgi:hypothetical protein
MSEDEGAGKGTKSPMPKVLKDLGEKAIERHERRPATPEISIAKNEGGWTFESPYIESDEDQWVALLFESFATRSNATFQAFTNQLAKLCSTEWHGEDTGWLPNEDELRAAIQIVRSTRPRNEAEACLAAQMVSVHLMQMKLSAQALRSGYLEPRSCAIAGKLARTYATQLETMAKLKGKGSRQRITVRKYAQHEHKHIHLHQGEVENGNQPHGPRGSRTSEIKASLEPSRCASLPGNDSTSNSVPMPSDEREEAVQAARRGGRFRRANR